VTLPAVAAPAIAAVDEVSGADEQRENDGHAGM
jgi:hypothetical protein